MMSLLAPFRPLQSSLRHSLALCIPRNSLRYASLNSAIGRGIRKSQKLEEPRSWSKDKHDNPQAGNKASKSRRSNKEVRSGNEKEEKSWPTKVEFDEDEFIRTGNFRALPPEHQRFKSMQDDSAPTSEHKKRYDDSAPTSVPRKRDEPAPTSVREKRPLNFRALPPEHQRPERKRDEPAYISIHKRKVKKVHHRPTDTAPERVKENVKVPDTIPYTTPASEFIYGSAAVEAAIRASRRRLYKLYIYQSLGEELNETKVVLRKLALARNIQVKMAFAGWDRLLDKMSGGRPHNGCVLEVSPLPRLPIKALKPFQAEDDHFRVELAPQTREEAEINGLTDRVTVNHSPVQQQKRNPVVVMFDGIVDPGNLGAIIRSAYYLGVDAVVFAGRNSAPLSPVTIKASAGAAENMVILEVKNEVDFIQRSRANGWRFYAADAPSPGTTYIDHASRADGERPADDAGALIGQAPSVIMMGNEGSGLSNHIRSKADCIVSIPGARLSPELGVISDPARVDSLNVSVAAALLMEMFLRVPLGVMPIPRKDTLW